MEKTLKQLRQEKGISQIQMAIMLDMSYQNYRQYESGCYKAMSADIEKKISDILEIDYSYSRVL